MEFSVNPSLEVGPRDLRAKASLRKVGPKASLRRVAPEAKGRVPRKVRVLRVLAKGPL